MADTYDTLAPYTGNFPHLIPTRDLPLLDREDPLNRLSKIAGTVIGLYYDEYVPTVLLAGLEVTAWPLKRECALYVQTHGSESNTSWAMCRQHMYSVDTATNTRLKNPRWARVRAVRTLRLDHDDVTLGHRLWRAVQDLRGEYDDYKMVEGHYTFVGPEVQNNIYNLPFHVLSAHGRAMMPDIIECHPLRVVAEYTAWLRTYFLTHPTLYGIRLVHAPTKDQWYAAPGKVLKPSFVVRRREILGDANIWPPRG